MIVQIRTVLRPGTMYTKPVIDRSLSKQEQRAAASRRYYDRHRDEILARRRTKKFRLKMAAAQRARRAKPGYRERENMLERERRKLNPEKARQRGRDYYWRKKHG